MRIGLYDHSGKICECPSVEEAKIVFQANFPYVTFECIARREQYHAAFYQGTIVGWFYQLTEVPEYV